MLPFLGHATLPASASCPKACPATLLSLRYFLPLGLLLTERVDPGRHVFPADRGRGAKNGRRRGRAGWLCEGTGGGAHPPRMALVGTRVCVSVCVCGRLRVRARARVCVRVWWRRWRCWGGTSFGVYHAARSAYLYPQRFGLGELKGRARDGRWI